MAGQRVHQDVDMIRHDDPGMELVPFVIEMQERLLD